MALERSVSFLGGRDEGVSGPEKNCPICNRKVRTIYTYQQNQWMLRVKEHYDPKASGWSICQGSQNLIEG